MQSGAAAFVLGYGLTKATNWWLRSPNTNDTTNAWNVNTNGNNSNNNCSNSNGIRPALVEKPDRVSLN